MNPAKPFRVASLKDPALDRARMSLEAYGRTRDEAQVVAIPGMAVTWFHCRPLTAREASHLDRPSSSADRLLLAYMIGVTGVESYPHEGVTFEPTGRLDSPDGRRTIWTDDEINRVGADLSFEVLIEIGGIVYDRAMFVGNAWGGSVRSYTLPHWLPAVMALGSQHAEPRPNG